MGLLDGLLDSVKNGAQGQGALMQVAMQLIQQSGGLPGIVSKLQHGGLADHVGSWIGTGQNLPISGAQLQEVLGSGAIGELAQRLGLSHADTSSGLAQVLPQIIDKLTPAGQIPADHGGLLSQAMSMLQKTASN